MDKRVLFVTNNCMKTRDEYVAKFGRFGIETKKEQIYSSAYLAAVYLKRANRDKVFCFGSGAMREEMRQMGVDHFGLEKKKRKN